LILLLCGGEKMERRRFHFIDELRGIGIIYVVLYHIIYNLTYIFPIGISFIEEGWMYLLRDIMVGMLMFISGASGVFSKNNLKRGLKLLFFALIITIITFFMGRDYFISFGILHFLGTSILLYAVTQKYMDRIPYMIGAIVCFGLFIILKVTPELYYISGSTKSFFKFALGIYHYGFISTDYYPMIPWIFVFFSGSFFGKYLISKKEKECLLRENSKSLSFIGKNTIAIYLVHQPIVYGIMFVFYNCVRNNLCGI
jgi:uncharacterized membrane protein